MMVAFRSSNVFLAVLPYLRGRFERFLLLFFLERCFFPEDEPPFFPLFGWLIIPRRRRPSLNARFSFRQKKTIVNP